MSLESQSSDEIAARGNLYGLDRAALEDAMEQLGVPRFHGRQIFRWMYQRHVHDPADWTDLALPLRQRLAERYRVDPGRFAERVEATDGTIKWRTVLADGDGDAVETVTMPYDDRVTLCISSQVGCALACDFCLTAKMGLKRHLGPGEIVGQVALARVEAQRLDRPVNVVFMGMGEPLHNYDGVVGAVRLLTDPEGFGLSRQRLTVSTSGLVPAIERLAGEARRPRLAISLNATTDAVRDRLMPVNKRWPIRALLDAATNYSRTTRERVTLEYVLLEGINDSDEDVGRLARMARGFDAKINLIPFNAVEGLLAYVPPPRERIYAFRDALLARDAPVSIRWSRGQEARAACGQLALLHESGRGVE